MIDLIFCIIGIIIMSFLMCLFVYIGSMLFSIIDIYKSCKNFMLAVAITLFAISFIVGVGKLFLDYLPSVF